ncbi:unnamed protein product (mitochondrion) [Plasmodiophora brassicae]|uniref:Protein kinase domain-containing protein n=1 Tax=Plasmodiophora brassicae TaxID=37360 RepID=A0A3P3YFI9_PLABS|nr:unnamed protein product [Plasmodiophora brassicae]
MHDPPPSSRLRQRGLYSQYKAISQYYLIGKTIGEGTFGKVKKGVHRLTRVKVAIKILEKSRIVDVDDVERVSREIHILKHLKHPNIINLYEVIDTKRFVFLIMEYASGGELFDFIVKHNRVDEEAAAVFFHQIINGMEYCHNSNVIHRDLKPENLLLDAQSNVKIVDFGLGNIQNSSSGLLSTACGSPCYAPPEMIQGKPYRGSQSDIWSTGVILYALVCGYLPFEDPNTSALYKKICRGQYECPDFISPAVRDLISRILNTDPDRRLTVEEIRLHPWYAQVSCDTDPGRTIAPGKHGCADDPLCDDVISEMREMRYDINAVVDSVLHQRHDHNHGTYQLLLYRYRLGLQPALRGAPRPGSVTQRQFIPAPPPQPSGAITSRRPTSSRRRVPVGVMDRDMLLGNGVSPAPALPDPVSSRKVPVLPLTSVDRTVTEFVMTPMKASARRTPVPPSTARRTTTRTEGLSPTSPVAKIYARPRASQHGRGTGARTARLPMAISGTAAVPKSARTVVPMEFCPTPPATGRPKGYAVGRRGTAIKKVVSVYRSLFNNREHNNTVHQRFASMAAAWRL